MNINKKEEGDARKTDTKEQVLSYSISVPYH